MQLEGKDGSKKDSTIQFQSLQDAIRSITLSPGVGGAQEFQSLQDAIRRRRAIDRERVFNPFQSLQDAIRSKL